MTFCSDRLQFDHNRALEAGIVFHEQLDKLIASAIARRNSALEQLELYRVCRGGTCVRSRVESSMQR